MKQKPRALLAKGKQKVTSAADFVSVALVCLFPLVSGAIFFRLLYMGGAPNWFYVLQGVIFLGSLAQAIYFFSFGLIRALRRKGR